MALFRSDDFSQRRKSARYDLHYPAQVDPGGGAAPRSCVISDISTGGAKLTVGTQDVPEEFTLVFRCRCRVLHRADGQIGVQFATGG